MSSEFGSRVKVSVFGESHGAGIGCVVSGLPAGEYIDKEKLKRFMDRRRGGKALTTTRSEADSVAFLSGITDSKTNAFPLCAYIGNTDAHSKAYEAIRNTPRPGHADYTAFAKWGGNADMRGGGHFSGRLTAALCAAGGIALQILERRGVYVGSHILKIAGTEDTPFPPFPDKELFAALSEKNIPVTDDAIAIEMLKIVENARADGDSVGGIIECCIIGLKPGLGEPMFDGVESVFAKALFGIPAVKGVEFGAGFKSADMRGSEHNDAFIYDEAGRVMTETNNAGGVLGGITTGMPIVARVAFKPTPSIAKQQRSVDLANGAETAISVTGRHDACIALRCAPVVEAVMALVALDLLAEGL